MAKAKRILLHMVCSICKNKNYTTEKNPDSAAAKGKAGEGKDKLLLKKFCKFCRKATEHKEVKI